MSPARKKRGRKPAPIVSVGGTDHKACSRCKELKPLSEYPKKGSRGLQARCEPCFRLSATESRERQRNGTAKKVGPNLKLRKERFIDGVREKWCNTCKRFLAESKFAKHRSRYDGLHPYCRACNRSKQAAERARRGDDYRAMRRRYRDSEQGRRAYSKYKPTHPWQARAQEAVWREIEAGRMVKPGTCSECGRGDCIIDGHHDDYAKPLVVRWLCRWCHRKWHRLNGEAANANMSALSATG